MRTTIELIDMLAGNDIGKSAALNRTARKYPLTRAEYRRLQREGLITTHGTAKTIHLTKRGVAVRDRSRIDPENRP